ncbi:MAG: PSD1 domain-containing protein [Verrucomicrobiae bacterium]|nr:PSD1 domain-containing protein [Verrucomicrobiae bacterium]
MWVGASCFAATHTAQLPPAASRPVDFATDVQPLLAAHCYSCHGPERQRADLRWDVKSSVFRSGEPQPFIVPGRSAESRVIHLVAGLEPDSLMPPKGEPLTAEEIGLLRAWIDEGAVWPETESSNLEAATTHWSFKPVTRPDVPAVSPQDFRLANPIDHFIFAKLAENKLAPSREANRHTLIRRLYFDLIGLPPTPEEVREFEQDNSPGAYERLVDKLLGSPRYGERWARHWLDVVRFAETTGFEVNTPRPNAWPYRDYVIRAFNEDKPYDQFIREQLAGDILGEDAATGFLVAGPDDLVKSPDPALTLNQRADELHDMVSTAGSAFLGLTVGCARCHNHKFDPIPQTDYFALKAVFEGVKHGERRLRTADTAARETELASRRQRLLELDARLAEFEPLAQVGRLDTNLLRAPVNARQNLERFVPIATKRLRFTIAEATGAEPCIDELEVYTAETPPRNIALASAGTTATASSVFPNSEIHRLEHINDGKHGNSRSWISNERGKGWVELEFAETVAIHRVVWGRDREQKFADRLAIEYRIEVAVSSNDWRIVASSVDRLPYKSGVQEQPVVSVAGLTAEQVAEVKNLQAERKQLESRIAELAQVPMLYAGTFTESPPATRRFHRGDPMQQREEISPGALGAIPVRFDLDTAIGRGLQPAEILNAGGPTGFAASAAQELTEDQRRRLALARWISDPANPLTARVMANRLWQYHFGEGLVSTPSDFGENGARPTHPELLDWLASEFMQPTADWSARPEPHPWSLKHLHRLIVNSATYRQASGARGDALAVDAGARLLWRFPPRRLEAEAIRDQVLAISGKLDLQMGGPGFSFFEPNDNYVRVYAPKQEFGPETFRRMIYGTVVRQRPDGVFGVFDCPDGGQIAPKRTRSTTPLQALNLLNSGFVMQQADFLAERLQREAGPNAEAQVRRAFALAFQRQPDHAELGAAAQFVQTHGLQVFCRALFNANEFVYLF